MQRHKQGDEKFNSFLSEKVVAVAGDVSLHNFGIKDQTLLEKMLEDIEIIVHSAATTRWDERFDIAMSTNTMGAYNTLNFAKMCPRIQVFLHVSTAYVCGEEKGLKPEEPFQMGQTLKGSLKLDINLEKKLIEQKLSELHTQNANEETITSIMKELGATRANLHGWPNVYVFTKAMGEMLVTNMKGNIPLIITRPTSIISTHSKPFPGWIERAGTIDFVLVEYFKGARTSFVGNPKVTIDLTEDWKFMSSSWFDHRFAITSYGSGSLLAFEFSGSQMVQIPADMVINSMIIALLIHSMSNPSNNLIYHIGTSLRNPIKLSDIQDLMHLYNNTKNPWLKNYEKFGAFYEKFTFNPNYTEDHELLQRKGAKRSRLKRIINIYRTYLCFEGIFDDKNTEKLRMAIKDVGSVDKEFNLDPKSIDWKDYLMNVHFPGLVKYTIQPKM
ncbi:hypothetical protein PIB30_057130 [Stylosanthes scabra]|uniref:Fatty acyl-CoA reductase n=1 Tax=Stylosanthes scabra TaxID=79078 RepID=A0ABU6TK57_9FABA|nr:hypothetical protein [Stylosanthes scabra]